MKFQENDDDGGWGYNWKPILNKLKKELKPVQRHEEDSRFLFKSQLLKLGNQILFRTRKTSLESNLITTLIKHLYSPSLIGIITDDMQSTKLFPGFGAHSNIFFHLAQLKTLHQRMEAGMVFSASVV